MIISLKVQRPSRKRVAASAAKRLAPQQRVMIWSALHRDMQRSKDGTGLATLSEHKVVYGMGEPSLAGHLGKQLHEVKPIFEAYHTNMPFVKETYSAVQSAAQRRGWIRTIGKRLRRFERWESSNWNDKGEDFEALAHEEALEKWGPRVRRAFCHKALNSLLQGSAADIMKEAMRQIWEAGLCDVLGAPLLTVHDELDWSVPDTAEAMEAAKEVHRIMETCVPLSVPLRAEAEFGTDWGHLEKFTF